MMKYYVADQNLDNQISNKKELLFSFKEEISLYEYEQVFSWFNFTGYYSNCNLIKRMVDTSANSFLSYRFVTSETPKKEDYFQTPSYIIEGNRLLITYLSFLKIFIDITQHEISALGKEKLNGFKSLNSSLYDSIWGYRFCTRMRNYVVHFGMPLTQFNNSIEKPCQMMCVKSGLLRFDGWSKLKDEISKLPEQFEMNQFVEESQEAIRVLYLHALELVFEDAVKGYDCFQDFCKSHGVARPLIVLFDEERPNDPELYPFPLHLIKEYFEELSKHPCYNIKVDVR